MKFSVDYSRTVFETIEEAKDEAKKYLSSHPYTKVWISCNGKTIGCLYGDKIK